jgi:hypothetical protein
MLERIHGNLNPYTMLWVMLISTIPMENNMEIPRNLKIELPYDQEILLLGIYTKEHKSEYN